MFLRLPHALACCFVLGAAIPSGAQTQLILIDPDAATTEQPHAQSPDTTVTPQPEPAWVAPTEAETNVYLGPENAKLCAPEDKGCIPPILVSAVCDVSQFVSCRTLARAIRHSSKLYLLYPFRTTRQEQRLVPDVTVIYAHENGFGMHTIIILPGSLENVNGPIYTNNTRRSVNFDSSSTTPSFIITKNLTQIESLSENIENHINSIGK